MKRGFFFLLIMFLGFTLCSCKLLDSNTLTNNTTNNNTDVNYSPTMSVSDSISDGIYINIDITNDKNVILAKYDINILIDDSKIGVVKNGSNFSSQIVLSKGKHSIKFIDSSSTSVYTEKNFEIDADSTLKCKLKAHELSIELLSFEVTTGLEDSTVEIPDLRGMMLSDAKKYIKSIGIMNINDKTIGNETIIIDENWIVINQSIDPGTQIDKNQSIMLECGRVSDFVDKYLSSYSLKYDLEQAEKYKFSTKLIDEITGETKNFSLDDENLDDWEVSTYITSSGNSKTVTYKLSYKGTGIVPSVIDLRASQAREILKKSYFTNIKFYTIENKLIEDENNWIVVEQSVAAGEEILVTNEISIKVEKYVPPTPTPTKESLLEEKFPKEIATRVVVTAITNYYALDVLTNDEVDVTKFHSYSDESGNKEDYYLTIKINGIWSANDDETWHVEGINLYKAGWGSTFGVTADVRMIDDEYEIYNVIDSNGTSDSNTHVYPDHDIAFIVSEDLVKYGRKEESASPTSSPSPSPTLSPTPTEMASDYLTVDNNEDLAELVSLNRSKSEKRIKELVNSLQGKYIEIILVVKDFENIKNTRFKYTFLPVYNDKKNKNGPLFFFEDVGYVDFRFKSGKGPGSLDKNKGIKCCIKIDEYKNGKIYVSLNHKEHSEYIGIYK